MCVCIYAYIHMYIHIYIYTCTEREREREHDKVKHIWCMLVVASVALLCPPLGSWDQSASGAAPSVLTPPLRHRSPCRHHTKYWHCVE